LIANLSVLLPVLLYSLLCSDQIRLGSGRDRSLQRQLPDAHQSRPCPLSAPQCRCHQGRSLDLLHRRSCRRGECLLLSCVSVSHDRPSANGFSSRRIDPVQTSENECFITAEFAKTHLQSMVIENQVPITIQRTDLVVLDEIILAATTTKAYDTISSGTHVSLTFTNRIATPCTSNPSN